MDQHERRLWHTTGGAASGQGNRTAARDVQKLELPTSLPVHLLMVVFAGWLNRQQQSVIEYLQTENELLKSQLGGRRLRLTDEQRRRLAVKGRALGRKLLAEVASIVTQDTILAWHRRLVALKGPFVDERWDVRASSFAQLQRAP